MDFKDVYNEEENLTEDELLETILEYEELFENVKDILDDIFEEDINEIVKRVKIDPKTKRERKKNYRLNRHKIKRKADKYKKTAKYKMAQRKYKLKSKRPGYVKKKFV